MVTSERQIQAAKAFLEAFRTADSEAVDAVAPLLDDAVVVESSRSGHREGREAVIDALRSSALGPAPPQVEWSEWQEKDGRLQTAGQFPRGAAISTVAFSLTLEGGRIVRIEQEVTMAPPPPLVELVLTEEMKKIVNGAFYNSSPFAIAYVDEQGKPSLSFRGTTQAWSDTQLAFWARSGEGGLPRAIAQNPNIALICRDTGTRSILNFRGRAHVENDGEVRRLVFENSPAAEQSADPGRRGVAIIIDLDEFNGVLPSGRVRMQRDAPTA